MTNVMVMNAFEAVNEQATRVAWRTVAFSRMKKMPGTEEKAAGVRPKAFKPQSLGEQFAVMQRATKLMERR